MRRDTSSGLLALLAVAGITVLAISPALSKATAAATVSYTSVQAATGKALYQSSCSTCHGTHLEGVAGPALSGAGAKHLTITGVFDLMTTEMPLNAPASLSHDQYVAIMAYVLMKNGMKPGTKPLTYGEAMKSRSLL